MSTPLQRRERKSIWLSPDAYNALEGLKGQYEEALGPTDWGKFLLFVAGVAIGAGALLAITGQGGRPGRLV